MSKMNLDNLEYLLKRWANNQITPQEMLELEQLLQKEEANEPTSKLLQELWDNHIPSEPLFELSQRNAMLRHILPGAAPKTQQGFIRRITSNRWMVAAAVAGLLAVGTLTYMLMNDATAPPAPANAQKDLPGIALVNDVAAGKQGAILTLSNGKEIVLDGEKDGILHQNEEGIVTKENGVLSYTGIANETGYHTMTTPRGRLFQLVLPDGSHVWLNAASSIRYPTSFTQPVRKVQVTGEAYFEITPDKSKPFIVESPAMSVEVLGTSFNINAYSDERSVKTTLLSGSVRVTGNTGNGIASLVMARPGQQSILELNKKAMHLESDVNINEAIAWKNGLILFDDCDLETIMRQISRWYDVEIKYEGAIPKRTFTGEISRETNVSELLKILTLSKIRFKVEDKTITVMQ